MIDKSLNEIKSSLVLVLQSHNLEQSLINEMLSDEFIHGVYELIQNEPENDEFMSFVRNFSEEQNLKSIADAKDKIIKELETDGYFCSIFQYIIDAWRDVYFSVSAKQLQIKMNNNSEDVTSEDIEKASTTIDVVFDIIDVSPPVKTIKKEIDIYYKITVAVHNQQKKFYEIAAGFWDKIWNIVRPRFNDGKTTSSPLIVDLDGDGVETTTTENGTHFDHDGNGFAEKSGWVGQDDGLLVRDINGNSEIDNGTELFGNNSVLSSGEKAANGFEALKDLDSNGDGVFNAEDNAWSEVKIWQDANGNGKVDSNELITLEQANISGINLGYTNANIEDSNGNIIGQEGSFIKSDGTTGSIKDIWFDTNLENTIDQTDVEIPDDIKLLPDVAGFGNVHSLQIAMALDDSGELKALVQQFATETNIDVRKEIMLNIIYHWTGVQDMDPRGRDPQYVYGPVLDDCRKLEALEEFMGEEFLGTWCWGERDPNPHGKAAPYILEAFDIIYNYAYEELLKQTHYKSLLEGVTLTWNEANQTWDIDVSNAVSQIQAVYTVNAERGISLFKEFESIIKNTVYNDLQSIYEKFRLTGSLTGNELEVMLAKFGFTYGTEGHDTLNGSSGVDEINGLAGNDKIYAGGGNDILDGGDGNDTLWGEDGNDTLIGGAGNDTLIGGNGADTYIFNPGFGNDVLDNSDDNASADEPDIIQFGEGILPEKVTLQRQGYDLIITVAYNADETGVKPTDDSLRIYSYFDEQGTTSATVNKIVFANGTEWNYEYILNNYDSIAGAGGGKTVEGDNQDNNLSGTNYDDVLVGNGGNDTLNAGNGNDRLIGGAGNDTLNGGAGNDAYLWNWGDGMDTISDGDNHDRISFGAGIYPSDLTFRQVSNTDDLQIIVKGNENQGMIIKNFFWRQNYKIEDLYFNNGERLSLPDINLTLRQSDDGEIIRVKDNVKVVYANGGNDTVHGSNNADVIYGGDGFDTLNGNNGDDLIIGGRGNDIINGGNGNDTYVWNLGDGLDEITDYVPSSTESKQDKIKFGSGIVPEDISFRRENSNLRVIVNNDDTQGIIVKDFFSNGYNKIEQVEFTNGQTIDISQGMTLVQSDASETFSGTEFNDIIYGMGGDDDISAGNGDDIIIGGKGNDVVNGGNGNDTYIWNLGDGFDTIIDYVPSSTESKQDKIKFGEGITASDLSFRRNGYDLIINVKDEINQGIKIVDFYSNSYNQVETVEFADGSTLDLTAGLTFTYMDKADTESASDGNDIIYGMGGDDNISAGNGDDVISGGTGNDVVNGGNGNDTYIWNLGDGFDTIIDYVPSSTESKQDKIKFGEGIAPEDVTFRHVGYDLMINVNGDPSQGMKIVDYFSNSHNEVEYVEFADGTSFRINDGVTFKYDDGDETVGATDGNDIIYGMGGDDNISAGNGDDIIIGGTGNDIVNGGNGNDTYIWNLGDGFDTITDYVPSSTESKQDKIKFGEGIAPEDVTFRHVGYDLMINVNGDPSQGMKIVDYFSNSHNEVEYVEFADGTSFRINDGVTFKYDDGDETVGATDGNDIIYGMGGDDNISAGNGDDIIIGGTGNDIVNGGNGNDTYIWNLGDGFDTITDYVPSSTESKQDKIKFGEGISFDDLSFYRNGYDLFIYVKNDFGQGISVKDYFYGSNNEVEYIELADGTTVNIDSEVQINENIPTQTIVGTINDETLTGGIGNDTINGDDGSDIITGNQGNDVLNGGNDDDVYVWNMGDGFDTITDEHGEFDIISFGENIAYEDLTFSRVGDDLLINVNADPYQGMKIVNFYKNDANKIEYLEFSDGSLYDIATSPLVWSLSNGDDTVAGTDYDDTIYGNSGNDMISSDNGDDILIGGTGNDTLNGGSDNDTYVYNLGDGLDTITDTHGVADKIKFGTGIASSDITFRQNGSDLQIFVNAALTEGMIVKDFYKSGSANQIEVIEFADGSKLNISALGLTLSQSSGDDAVTGTDYEDVVYGNGGNDTINTGNGNDTINTGNGDDTLIGGTGNDILTGSNGNDTYVWNLGDGLDTVTDGQGTADKILFGAGISLNNLKFTQEGKNLRIYVNDNIEQGFVIVNFYNSNADKIEKLEFADGSTFNLSTQGLTLTQPNGDNVVNGTVYADVVYGNNGMDTISTGNGHDMLVGGQGNDILDGGRGNDTYIWNLGDGMDTITDANGNDKIVFGAGISEADVQFTQEGNNLRITIKDDFNQGMLIKNFFSSTANKVELIEFANGETLDISQGLPLTQTNGSETINGTGLGDVIYGMDGNDTISANGNNTFIGGKGNDVVNGGTGNDTYVYNLGDGFDTINESGGNDKIVFGEGISQNDLSFERIGNHLKICINGDEIKGLQINNQFSTASDKVETIEFADGSTMDISNADQLIQAMNGFSVGSSASTDTLSNPTQDVGDMYSLAANSDLTRKAV